MGFLSNLFGIRSNASAKEAKGRLISVLIHDRTDISPQLLENLRIEMIALLKKYMDIDEANIEIDLDRGSREVALVANVPVLRVKRGAVDVSGTDYLEGRGPQSIEPPRGNRSRRRR